MAVLHRGAISFGMVHIPVASNWVRAADGDLPIWFTNPAENDVYLLLRIRRASDGKTIYESGLLRPGEYIETLPALRKLPTAPIEADVAIYSFAPETYHSLGTIHLSGEIE